MFSDKLELFFLTSKTKKNMDYTNLSWLPAYVNSYQLQSTTFAHC